MAERIGQVFISREVNAKINARHRLSADDVLHVCWTHTRQQWVHDERGWRLYVEGETEFGAPVIVILYPTRDLGPHDERSDYGSDLWNLGTAIRG